MISQLPVGYMYGFSRTSVFFKSEEEFCVFLSIFKFKPFSSGSNLASCACFISWSWISFFFSWSVLLCSSLFWGSVARLWSDLFSSFSSFYLQYFISCVCILCRRTWIWLYAFPMLFLDCHLDTHWGVHQWKCLCLTQNQLLTIVKN